MSSPPQTPSAMLPEADEEGRFISVTTPTEWIEAYRPGHLHPVQIGDSFEDGRYKVLRKLGNGSFSTVWLAKDQHSQGYVALKILESRQSALSKELELLTKFSASPIHSKGINHITTFLDSFKHSGPNGHHLCLVLEPMGPSVSSMIYELPCNKPRRRGHRPRYPLWMAKDIIQQVCLGLDILHCSGITHGDVQPGNILFSVCGLDAVPEDALLQSLDEDSISEPVTRRDGKNDKWAPRYLAIGKPLDQYVALDKGFKVKLSDLGAAFYTANPPETVCTPTGLRAPEIIMNLQPDSNIDTWSLGCIIFELLTGQALFPLMSWGSTDDEINDEHLLRMYDVLGPLPSEILAKWTRSSRYFDSSGKRFNSNVGEDWEQNPYMEELSPSLEVLFKREKGPDVTEVEAELAVSLIRRILKYELKERPSMQEILEHKWFKHPSPQS